MIDFLRLISAARARQDYAAVVRLFPHAEFLGVEFGEEDEGLVFRLPFSDNNVGNRSLPALHGGVIGAFAEHAAIIHLLWHMESAVVPRVVDFSIDYLRPGRAHTLYAACRVLRQGQRVANASVECWQQDRSRGIAMARGHFLLTREADLNRRLSRSG